MNKYTDDQSTPAKSIHDEEAIHSTQLSSTTAEIRKQAKGMLKVDENESKAEEPTPVKKYWRKPSDMPKRGLSSYNIFYRMERKRIVEGAHPKLYTTEDVNQFLAEQKIMDESPKPKRKHRRTHGKISFTDLARVIASNWKNMDDVSKAPFHERAVIEKNAYTAAIAEWNKTKKTPGMRGTKRKADNSIQQKYGKSQTSDLSIADDKDSNYELYSDEESNIANDATDLNVRATGTENAEDDLPLHRRQEHIEHGKILTGMMFDATHQSDDLFPTGGTLNRSRSLSDITDYEELTLSNRRTIGQHNFSVHDQVYPSFAEQQRVFMNPRIGFNNPNGREYNTRLLPQTEHVTAPSISQQMSVQPHLYQMSEANIVNQYTSKNIQPFIYDRDQFPQNTSSHLTGRSTNYGQDHYENVDDPSQRNIRIGSFANDTFHSHSANLTRLHQMAPQPYGTHANMSSAISLTQRNYNVSPLRGQQMVRYDTTEIPQQVHPQQNPHQERPADFVTSFEDVQIGYAVLSTQEEATTQSYQPSQFLSPHAFQRPSDNQMYNLQQATYQVMQPFSPSEPSLPQLQRTSDIRAVNQSLIALQPHDRNFNAPFTQQASYQTVPPYRNIAPSQQYVQHPNDNNAINHPGAMFPSAQQYAQTTNDGSFNTTNDIGTQPQPSGFAQPHQQSADYQNNQSSDESQFWEF